MRKVVNYLFSVGFGGFLLLLALGHAFLNGMSAGMMVFLLAVGFILLFRFARFLCEQDEREERESEENKEDK